MPLLYYLGSISREQMLTALVKWYLEVFALACWILPWTQFCRARCINLLAWTVWEVWGFFTLGMRTKIVSLMQAADSLPSTILSTTFVTSSPHTSQWRWKKCAGKPFRLGTLIGNIWKRTTLTSSPEYGAFSASFIAIVTLHGTILRTWSMFWTPSDS